MSIPLKKAVVPYHVLHRSGFSYMAGNHFIHTGYRVHYSTWDCIVSLFELHNETWNVWIHIVGTLVFLCLFLATFFDHLYSPTIPIIPLNNDNFHTVPMNDSLHHPPLWPLHVFLCGVLLCFLLSAMYHLLSARGKSIANLVLQLDFAGIITLIVGCYVPSIYYGFYCDAYAQVGYLGSVGILAALLLLFSFIPSFKVHTKVRVLGFLSMIFFALIPIGDAIYRYGVWDDHVQIMIKPALMCSIFNFPGLFFYLSRVPERWYPGVFDVWGSSHQWWHLCVVVAALVYYVNLLEHYTWRCETSCDIVT